MNLVGYTATALSRNDIEDTPTNKNVVDFAIVELKDLQGNLVTIYDDAEGLNPETQKTCDTNGQVTFFAEIGDYILEINGKAQSINLSSGLAEFISTKTDESVQDFIDTFSLKIFQSPTDGGLTEIQTRTVNGGEVYEVRKTSDNSLATIYSNAAGTIEIVQNGTDNVSGSDGVIEFYIDDGKYYININSTISYFSTTIIDYFGTVADAKSYAAMGGLIGSSIYIKEREAFFEVLQGVKPTSLGDYALIDSNVVDCYFQIKPIVGTVTAKGIGAIGDGSTRTQDAFIDAINLLPIDTRIDIGGHENEYILYTSDDGTVNFGANVLDFTRRVHIVGRGGKLKLDANVKAYIAEINVDDVFIEGVCFDGNRGSNENQPTSNYLLRAVSVDRGTIQYCQFINGASSGCVIDGGSRWKVQYNYFDSFYRNALQVASSGVIRTNENEILFNYINGTDDGEFANGIFLSASADTSKKDLTCYRNKIIGNVVKNAGDWGIESGYRMFYTLIQGNIVDSAFNICIGARDNTGTIIDGNVATSNINGDLQINFQVDGNSIPGDDIAPNNDCKVIVSNNVGIAAGVNGVNIKDARKVMVSNNIIIGRGAGLGVGINVKGDFADVNSNYIEAYQFAYRLSKDDLSPLYGIKIIGNSANGVGNVFRQEGIELVNSVISGNDSSQITTLYSNDVAASVVNSRYFGNIVVDEPFKWSSFLNSFILSVDGLQRSVPGTQFGESAIFTPARSCTLRVKLDSGEVALFLIGAESTPTVAAIVESASIGAANSGKDYRIEVNGSNIVFKRYAATANVSKWFGEIS